MGADAPSVCPHSPIYGWGDGGLFYQVCGHCGAVFEGSRILQVVVPAPAHYGEAREVMMALARGESSIDV